MSGWFSKLSLSNGPGRFPPPELNGYDIFVALFIDLQDCGENWSHLGWLSLHPF
jgi:hypothetical protein